MVEIRAEGEGEMSERHLVDPTPELPDDTPVDRVRFPTRIHNVLTAAGLKTVGEVRETTDETLLSFQDLGPGSIKHLRETLGLPSTNGVRPHSSPVQRSAKPLRAAFARYGISRASVSSAIMKACSAKASSSALIHAKWIIRSATFQ
jgi:hypothetical protein